jgi:hypothetical protein
MASKIRIAVDCWLVTRRVDSIADLKCALEYAYKKGRHVYDEFINKDNLKIISFAAGQ